MDEDKVQEAEALDKKYRPKSFDEVAGNPELLMTIRSILSRPTGIPSSFLLEGPSGCGKTTLSRIIARELGGTDSTIKEYNISNMTGVDTARKIIDHARFKPFGGRKKIYILNECFPAGTIISGPNGYLMPIDKVNRGDVVFTLTGESVVEDQWKNKIPLNRIVKVKLSDGNNIFCSKDHLFFTTDGWKKACNLTKKDFIFKRINSIVDSIKQTNHFKEITYGSHLSGMPEKIRSEEKGLWKNTLFVYLQVQITGLIDRSRMHVWKEIYLQAKKRWNSQKTILQLAMRCSMETIASWSKRKMFNWWKARCKKTTILDESKQERIFKISFRKDEKEQPCPESAHHGKDESNKKGKRNPSRVEGDSWWKWLFNRTSKAPCFCFGMADGSGGWNWSKKGRTSHQIYNRYCQFKAKNWNRSGRDWSSTEENYRVRQKENGSSGIIGVENIEIYQPGNNDESFVSVVTREERNQGFAYFYDLQIKGHPSYYANDILVHNCHKASNAWQNAMLEVLEEPPSYIHFILCTTEPNKLLKTILTRCTRLPVKALRSSEIVSLLDRVCQGEDVGIAKEVLSKIAQSCEGSPRQALVMLDAVIDCKAENQMECINKFSLASTNTLILCQALMDKKSWGDVVQVILNLENEPEETRLGILSYMEKVLLQPIKGKPGQKHLRAWEIIEAMSGGIFHRRAQLTAKCFELINS